jgi:hypothetical protein
MATPIPGSGVVLKRGDGGVGAGVKASRTMGTGDATLVVRWGTAGTAGNSKTAAILVAGNNTPLSVTVTTSAVTINAATDGSGNATSTPNDIIAALYADATFVANWEADNGAGDGTDAVSAATSASLSGGSAGAEIFTAIAMVKGVRGPSISGSTADITSFDSPNGFREFIGTLRDGGTLSFSINYDPADATHTALMSDLIAGVTRNFQQEFPTTPAEVLNIAGIVTGFEITAELEQVVQANCTIKITAEPTWA